MPRNGSGIYGPPAGTAAVPNTTIESADYNAVVADMSQALTDSVNVNGTAPFQANQPMGNSKLTSLGAGSAATDSVNLGQAQSGIIAHATSVGGTADAIALTFSPAFAAYAARMRFRFTAAGANTLINPTVNVDGLGVKTIKKLQGAALAAADIAGSGHVCECVYDGTDVLLLNFAPMTPAEPNTFTEKQTFNRPVITPMTTLADAATIAWDMNAASNDVRIVLSASRNLGLPANINAGQKGCILIQQDGTGGWTLTPNAVFKQAGGQTVFDLDTAANTKTLYRYEVIEDHSAAKVILIKRMWSEGKNSIGFYKEYIPTQNSGSYAVGTIYTVAHDLGRLPAFTQVWVENTTTEHGYALGTRVYVNSMGDSDTFNRMVIVAENTTNVIVRTGNQSPGVLNNSFSGQGITPGNWRVIVRIYE